MQILSLTSKEHPAFLSKTDLKYYKMKIITTKKSTYLSVIINFILNREGEEGMIQKI